MARKPMVTRTIKVTKAVVLCLNITTAEPFNEVVTIPGTPDEKKLFKMVKDSIESDTIKPVHIVSSEVEECMYGMLEEDFIRLAYKLDENRKIVNEEVNPETQVEE